VNVITSTPEHYLNADERIDIEKRIENTLKNIAPFHIKKGYYGYPEYGTLIVAHCIFKK